MIRKNDEEKIHNNLNKAIEIKIDIQNSGKIERSAINPCVDGENVLIREMQVKTIMNYHLTPVRMAHSRNIPNKRWRVWEKGKSFSVVGGNVNQCSHFVKQSGLILKN